MRAILLGPLWSSRYSKKSFKSLLGLDPKKDLFIGIDGGAAHWQKWNILPHLAVGDWDSLKGIKKILATVKFITLPKNKCRSDLFYACIAAIGAGADEIVCLGVTGGRADHHQAMLFDLSEFAEGTFGNLSAVCALGNEGDYYFLSKKIRTWKTKNAQIGHILSIFSMSNFADGVTLCGFQYSLKDAVLPSSSLGLSNQFKKRNCEIRLRKGKLLIIIPNNGK